MSETQTSKAVSPIPSVAANGAPTGTPESASKAGAAGKDEAKAANKPKDPEKDQDEIQQLVSRLQQTGRRLGGPQQELVREIGALVKEAAVTANRDDLVFRTRVAYAVQDIEKVAAPIPMGAGLRTEMTALAATYPGLQDDRMKALVARTREIDHAGTVWSIRNTAARVAAQFDQTAPIVGSQIDSLENRLRLTPHTPDTSATFQASASSDARDNPASRQQTPVAPVTNGQEQAAVAGQPRPGRLLVDIMNAIRKPEPEAPAPWDRQLTPMGDRITAYTAKLREGEQEQGFRRAERSGEVALQSMKAFSDGPGSVLMSRIRDAAKTDPNGMTGVLAEMREGGRYAGLRQDFNVALQEDKSFVAAYEKAASGVAKFGADRVEVARIAEGRTDSAAIAGRFEKLDAMIGRAASELPGRKDGKSFTDELVDRASEIVRKAVETVTAAINRFRPSAGPSAGM